MRKTYRGTSRKRTLPSRCNRASLVSAADIRYESANAHVDPNRRIDRVEGFSANQDLVIDDVGITPLRRIGEAIGFERGDLDTTQLMIIVRHAKFGKSRLVPLQPSTMDALRSYADKRDGSCPNRTARRSSSRPPAPDSCPPTSARRSGRCSTSPGSERKHRPRVHDIRHSFAVHTLARSVAWLYALGVGGHRVRAGDDDELGSWRAAIAIDSRSTATSAGYRTAVEKSQYPFSSFHRCFGRLESTSSIMIPAAPARSAISTVRRMNWRLPTIIHIGDNRNRHRGGDPSHVLERFGEADQSESGRPCTWFAIAPAPMSTPSKPVRSASRAVMQSLRTRSRHGPVAPSFHANALAAIPQSSCRSTSRIPFVPETGSLSRGPHSGSVGSAWQVHPNAGVGLFQHPGLGEPRHRRPGRRQLLLLDRNSAGEGDDRETRREFATRKDRPRRRRLRR